MAGIKGIIMDKDGTLFRYGEVWGPVLSEAIVNGLYKAGMPENKKESCVADFCKVVGVAEDGTTYPDGIIFRHDKLLLATLRILRITFRYRMNPWRVWKCVQGIMKHENFNLSKHLDKLSFTDVTNTIKALRERGYILGIVTTDTAESTDLFLSKMGIKEYISFLRTKDSPTPKKPNPEAIREFCNEFNLESNEVAVIGDTIVDMEFGRMGGAGYTIAVLTGSGDRAGLEKTADKVYPTLPDILKDPILFS